MKGNIALFSSKAKQLTHRCPKVQSTSPLPARCPRGNSGAKGIKKNADDERHYDIKNSREHKGKTVGNWKKLEDFSKIIRCKIKQPTAFGHKFANWQLGTLGKFDLLQRWRRARAAKSAPIFSTSESRELWRSSYFIKTRLDYSNIMANYLIKDLGE